MLSGPVEVEEESWEIAIVSSSREKGEQKEL